MRKFFIRQAAIIMLPLVAYSPLSANSAETVSAAAEGWTHPHSKIFIPNTLGGLKQSGIKEFAKDNLDVGLNYLGADKQDEISVYVFRKTNGSVPLWFNQARIGIEARDIYASPKLTGGIEVISLPKTPSGQGLRAVYSAGQGSSFASTGLMMFAVGEWYVKLRVSSVNRNRDALANYMDEILAAIVLPQGTDISNTLKPIENCTAPLVFGKKKSKDLKNDFGASLLGAALLSVIMDKESDTVKNAKSPSDWCLDSQNSDGRAVYRPDSAEDTYLYALGDSGRAIVVSPDASLQLMKGKMGYSVVMNMPDSILNFPSQNILPSPDRVLEMFRQGKINSQVSTWGDQSTITIGAD